MSGFRGHRDDGNVSQWTCACRGAAVRVRPKRRSSLRICLGDQIASARVWRMDAAEDGHAAAFGRPVDRLVRNFSSAARRSGSDSFFVYDGSSIDRRTDRVLHLGHTTEETAANYAARVWDRSPLYSGQIEGIGPRGIARLSKTSLSSFRIKREASDLSWNRKDLDTHEVYMSTGCRPACRSMCRRR